MNGTLRVHKAGRYGRDQEKLRASRKGLSPVIEYMVPKTALASGCSLGCTGAGDLDGYGQNAMINTSYTATPSRNDGSQSGVPRISEVTPGFAALGT